MTATPATSTHSIFRAEGFSCPSCVVKIEKQVGRLKGVQNVSVKFASGRVEVDHDASVTTPTRSSPRSARPVTKPHRRLSDPHRRPGPRGPAAPCAPAPHLIVKGTTSCPL